jgi:hypothetical protein
MRFPMLKPFLSAAEENMMLLKNIRRGLGAASIAIAYSTNVITITKKRLNP